MHKGGVIFGRMRSYGKPQQSKMMDTHGEEFSAKDVLPSEQPCMTLVESSALKKGTVALDTDRCYVQGVEFNSEPPA